MHLVSIKQMKAVRNASGFKTRDVYKRMREAVPHLACGRRAVDERRPQGLQPRKVVTMHMAQEARQGRPVLGLVSEVIDADLRKFGDDAFEGGHARRWPRDWLTATQEPRQRIVSLQSYRMR
jgi:hypothetical protein